MEIHINSILIWITAITIGSTAITVYLGSDKLSSRAFAFCILIVSLWITSAGFLTSVENPVILTFASKLNYFLGGNIAAGFLYFFYTFPDDTHPPKRLTCSLLLLQIIFFFLYFFTDCIIGASFSNGTWILGPFSFLFDIFFFGFFIYGIVILVKKYISASDVQIKKHIKFMTWVIIVGFLPPSLFSIILPRFGIYNLDWLGPVSEVFWIPIIAYSIIKHRLFNTKVIAIELVTFALWIIILIRTFLAQNFHEILVESALLLVTMVFSILLIRSVLHEIEQREQIERLATDLKKAYGHLSDFNDHLEQKVEAQTLEIRKSYEVEKRARIQLERLNRTKDTFITTTQHELRTPLTTLKWEISSLQATSPTTPTSESKESLDNIKSSIERLDSIIENFISITEDKEK
ncbi:MAG: histidine kinase dimerization/phospho-acceptor domain-containing protein [Patescibacteria group bacterium]